MIVPQSVDRALDLQELRRSVRKLIALDGLTFAVTPGQVGQALRRALVSRQTPTRPPDQVASPD
jgi:hypothetical protein